MDHWGAVCVNDCIRFSSIGGSQDGRASRLEGRASIFSGGAISQILGRHAVHENKSGASESRIAIGKRSQESRRQKKPKDTNVKTYTDETRTPTK